MTDKSAPLTSRVPTKKQQKDHKIKLDDILNRTKETLSELANKQSSDVVTTTNNEESNPKKLDLYSIDNFESDKPKNINKNNKNNILSQLTNESIVINETINGVEEQFVIEIKKIPKEKISEETKKPNKTKIRVKANKKKEVETTDDKISKQNSTKKNKQIEITSDKTIKHNTIQKNKEEPKTENKNNKKKKFHKNISADKIYSKLSDDEDSEFYSTTTRSKRIKNPKYCKSNNKKRNINRLNSSNTNNLATEKFMETYERFKETQLKNQKKIEEMKKMQEQKEKLKYRNKPKVNKNSMAMASKLNDDFYSRQKKLNEIKMKNTQQLREKLQKKEEDEINKSNILLNKKKKINCRNNSNKTKISNSVNKLYDWDTQRKQRLDNLKKSQDDKFNRDNNFNIPRINKNPFKITVNLKYDQKKTTNRLYEDDIKKRIQNQKALEQKYQCSFSPNVNPNSKYEKSLTKKKYGKNNNNNNSNNNINASQAILSIPTCSEAYNNSENVVDNGDMENVIRTKILDKLFKNKMKETQKKKEEESEEEEEEEDEEEKEEKSEKNEKSERSEKSEKNEKNEKNEKSDKSEKSEKSDKIKKAKKGKRNNSMANIKVSKMNSSDESADDFEKIVEKEMREDKKSILINSDNLYDQWLNGKSNALDKYLDDDGKQKKPKFKRVRNLSADC